MPQFKDLKGRTWDVSVNISSVKRTRDLTGVDLLDTKSGAVFERLASDPVMLIDVLYAICKPQADAVGVDDIAFGEAMAGDPIDEASRVLIDAIVGFTPNPSVRAALGEVAKKLNEAQGRVTAAATARLSSPEFGKKIDEEIERAIQEVNSLEIYGSTSTRSLESSE